MTNRLPIGWKTCVTFIEFQLIPLWGITHHKCFSSFVDVNPSWPPSGFLSVSSERALTTFIAKSSILVATRRVSPKYSHISILPITIENPQRGFSVINCSFSLKTLTFPGGCPLSWPLTIKQSFTSSFMFRWVANILNIRSLSASVDEGPTSGYL